MNRQKSYELVFITAQTSSVLHEKTDIWPRDKAIVTHDIVQCERFLFLSVLKDIARASRGKVLSILFRFNWDYDITIFIRCMQWFPKHLLCWIWAGIGVSMYMVCVCIYVYTSEGRSTWFDIVYTGMKVYHVNTWKAGEVNTNATSHCVQHKI